MYEKHITTNFFTLEITYNLLCNYTWVLTCMNALEPQPSL